MTTQICTTVEQSERLLAARVKPWENNMGWIKRYDWGEDYFLTPFPKDYLGYPAVSFIPAWDMATLLEMMPRRIDKYILSLNRFELGWYVAYKTDREGIVPESLHEECYDGTLFDVVVRMIEWLIKNGHFDKKWLYEEGGDK